jgi:hypothetical protein
MQHVLRVADTEPRSETTAIRTPADVAIYAAARVHGEVLMCQLAPAAHALSELSLYGLVP